MRCGYTTEYKSSIIKHFYGTKKSCPSLVNCIELTDEIKAHIMTNRIYSSPNTPPIVHPQTPNFTLHINKQIAIIDEKPKSEVRNEFYFQKILEVHLGGMHDHVACGKTDISTPLFHAEIKDWNNYKSAVGQLMCYNCFKPKPELRAYLFGKVKENDKYIALTAFKKLGIKAFELIQQKNQLFIKNHDDETVESIELPDCNL